MAEYNLFRMNEKQMREAVSEWLERRGMKVDAPHLVRSIQFKNGFFTGFTVDVEIVAPEVVRPLPPLLGPFRDSPDESGKGT